MRISFLILVAMLPFLAGCRNDGLHQVNGAITYRGQPVAKGIIRFLPVDGKGPTAAIPFDGGKYSVQVATGKKRVEIEGLEKVGLRPISPGNPNSPMIDDFRQILPERYGAKSELTAEIHRGKNLLDFHLTE